MNDWKAAISGKITAARDRLAKLGADMTGAQEAHQANERKAAALQTPPGAMMIVGDPPGYAEARGAAKHARQHLDRLKGDEQAVRAEVRRLEATLAIPERLEQAQVAMQQAQDVVAARTAELGVAGRTLQTLRDRKAAADEALRIARQGAGARMLEAARTGASASTDDSAQLISQLDAIELAIGSAQGEQAQAQKALASALGHAKAATRDVELIALEASEVAVQVVLEQFVPMLAQHMASHWRVHRESWSAPNILQMAAERVHQMQAVEDERELANEQAAQRIRMPIR